MQALSIAASGMMAAADRLNASAQRVAASDAAAAGVDYVKERTDQIGASADFKANAAVVRTAQEMSQQLLDMKV